MDWADEKATELIKRWNKEYNFFPFFCPHVDLAQALRDAYTKGYGDCSAGYEAHAICPTGPGD